MQDKLSGGYKKILVALAGILIFIVVICLIVFAGVLGLGSSLNSPSKNETGATAANIIIFPMIVVVVAIFGLIKWSSYRRKIRRNNIREELIAEDQLQPQNQQQLILNLLEQNGTLTLDGLEKLSVIDHEQLLVLVRQLMQTNQIKQSLQNGVAQLSLTSN